MFGTMFKYVCVAVTGAVAFVASGVYLDHQVIDNVKAMLEDHILTLVDLPEADRKAKMLEFVEMNRSDWETQIMFTSNLKELEIVLKPWS